MHPPRTSRLSTVYRYGIAIVGVGLATVLRSASAPMLGNRLPYLPFFFVVIPVAWHLGLGPSLVATTLATVAISAYFTESFQGNSSSFLTDLIGLVMFVTLALVVIWFAEANRIARRRLEREVTERVRAEATILDQIRRAEFGRDLGLALTSNPTLATVLDRCVALTVRHLGGDQAKIALVDESGRLFDPSLEEKSQAEPTDLREPVRGLIGRIVTERRSCFTNTLVDDSGHLHLAWLDHAQMVALAGCPLVVEDRLVGVWVLLSRQPLGEATIEAMEAMARSLALGIERKRGEENLRVEEARKTAILETSLDAIITMNHEGRIIEFNPAAERIFGHSAASIQGRALSEVLIPPTLRAAHRHGLAHYLATGEGAILNRRVEVQALRADDTEFPAEIAVTRIPIAGPPLFTAHIRDISARKQAEQALWSAKQDAEEANQAKDRFIAILSHELRTPLNPISLTINSILARSDATPDLRQDLESIRHYVGLEARLIDDLLDVMRIVRGKMPLRFEVTDAHRLIDQAITICHAEITAKSLRLTISLQAERHQTLGDPNRLRQVFWNLIKNAVKFTPAGGSITIRSRNEPIAATVSPPPAADLTDGLLIEVADDGIGIEPTVLPRIFEAFQQGDSSITRQFGGLGLGLAICNGVVEGHDGQLTARSPGKGQGTCFSVHLRAANPSASDSDPAAIPAVPKPMTPSPRSASTHFGPFEVEANSPPDHKAGADETLRVLVVEDEPTTIRLMSRLLRGLGHEVRAAETVAEATRWVEGSERFDLIVSDIGLPDGTGFDLMRHVRATRGGTPGIALTGFGTDEDIERSRLAGFSAHMTKPIDFDQFESLIRLVTHPAAITP